MPRKSDNKLIIDQKKYNEYKDIYNDLICMLENQYPVNDDIRNSHLVNFKENNNLPKHNWLKYKEGYASQLVSNAIKSNSFDKSKYVLDPFCGVGTTNLVAQEHGIKSIGFDINPIAILASQVKTNYYTPEERDLIYKVINNSFNCTPYKFKNIPKVLFTSFSSEVLKNILVLKKFIMEVQDNNVRSFLNLALISIVEDCSMRVKDGNGIKLKQNKKYIRDVHGHFKFKIENMLNDVQSSNYKIETNIFNESSIQYLDKFVEDDSISLCVFSPPYANCFDYLEVYKLEVWIGGFANKYEDFKLYRKKAMRSHVNSRFDHTIKYDYKNIEIISELITSFNIWNKNIPDMIRGYFDDTNILLKKLYNKLTKNSKVYIVVANSVYKGVIVPTDLLICDLAENVGYTTKSIKVARKIRSSPQQIPEIKHNNLMRESIIELVK